MAHADVIKLAEIFFLPVFLQSLYRIGVIYFLNVW
jgi:hypothetical protein